MIIAALLAISLLVMIIGTFYAIVPLLDGGFAGMILVLILGRMRREKVNFQQGVDK